jgi:hypothetical protein
MFVIFTGFCPMVVSGIFLLFDVFDFYRVLPQGSVRNLLLFLMFLIFTGFCPRAVSGIFSFFCLLIVTGFCPRVVSGIF